MKLFVESAYLLVSASAIYQKVIHTIKHRKQFPSTEEEARFNNFLQSTLEIEERNARYYHSEVGYMLGHNQLSDLNHNEVKPTLLVMKTIDVESGNDTKLISLGEDDCSSCYALAALAAIESAIAKKTGDLLDLSERKIIDCTFRIRNYLNNGCKRGAEAIAIHYVSGFGIRLESHYNSAHTKTHQECRKRGGKRVKYGYIRSKHEQTLAKTLVEYGPLTVALSANKRDFHFCSKGLHESPECDQKADHVILLIGYGTDKTHDYWLVKNSWGTDWGMKGFGKIYQCGIAIKKIVRNSLLNRTK
ncbi:cathepsin L1-like [Varroa destructor]|uniref:Uncharacterized protein n=1 Tax=Varroa destructor TaxID=109461 RepID=A0A7M7J1K9_VARDE|nr:cathepsin L1-like [Varroa destructor]